MKGRVIVLNTDPAIAALIVDGRVEDLMAGTGAAVPDVGVRYWAVVDRVAAGAAFVRLTSDTMGYLREAKNVRTGQAHLVQITADAEPGKAFPVTRKTLAKGRFLILTPGAPGVNLSRQIRDPEVREHLQARIMQQIDRHGAALDTLGAGLIVRTAATIATDAELGADLAQLLRDHARAAAEPHDRPPFDHPAPGSRPLLARALDEWAEPLADAVVVGSKALLDGAPGNPLPLAGTGQLEAMARYETDPFDHFGVWDEIERLKSPRADLPGGGWMAIEATRAMVTVDVNTGDQFNPGAAMTTNIEAVRELPRQLRLRGLGGQITIDFAPLKKMHRRKLEESLKTAFRRDPVATTLAGWTPLGNFELQRKRERPPLAQVSDL